MVRGCSRSAANVDLPSMAVARRIAVRNLIAVLFCVFNFIVIRTIDAQPQEIKPETKPGTGTVSETTSTPSEAADVIGVPDALSMIDLNVWMTIRPLWWPDKPATYRCGLDASCRRTPDGMHILSISLSDAGLQGTLPPILKELNELHTLRLSTNPGITGPLPVEWGMLPKIHTIDVSVCSLTGSIPQSWTQLHTLEYLYVGKNRLTSLPSKLDGWRLLKRLSAHSNMINQPLSGEMAEMRSLIWIDMSHNLIPGSIPAIFGTAFTALRDLSVQFNRLTGTLPAQLGQLPLVEELNFETNLLHGTIPASMAHIRTLVHLGINQNYAMTGPIPSGFESLPQFEALQINGTKICSLTIPDVLLPRIMDWRASWLKDQCDQTSTSGQSLPDSTVPHEFGVHTCQEIGYQCFAPKTQRLRTNIRTSYVNIAERLPGEHVDPRGGILTTHTQTRTGSIADGEEHHPLLAGAFNRCSAIEHIYVDLQPSLDNKVYKQPGNRLEMAKADQIGGLCYLRDCCVSIRPKYQRFLQIYFKLRYPHEDVMSDAALYAQFRAQITTSLALAMKISTMRVYVHQVETTVYQEPVESSRVQLSQDAKCPKKEPVYATGLGILVDILPMIEPVYGAPYTLEQAYEHLRTLIERPMPLNPGQYPWLSKIVPTVDPATSCIIKQSGMFHKWDVWWCASSTDDPRTAADADGVLVWGGSQQKCHYNKMWAEMENFDNDDIDAYYNSIYGRHVNHAFGIFFIVVVFISMTLCCVYVMIKKCGDGDGDISSWAGDTGNMVATGITSVFTTIGNAMLGLWNMISSAASGGGRRRRGGGSTMSGGGYSMAYSDDMGDDDDGGGGGDDFHHAGDYAPPSSSL